jgi:hypothetical protein
MAESDIVYWMKSGHSQIITGKHLFDPSLAKPPALVAGKGTRQKITSKCHLPRPHIQY